MNTTQEARLVELFKKMFGCDTARISRPCGKLFLIIGYNRNTKDDAGQWYKNDKPIDFDYVQEKVVASGNTSKELMRSAKEYKRLSKLSRASYFQRAAEAI